MRRIGRTKMFGGAVAMAAAVSLLAGCAELPADASWIPPTWPDATPFVTVIDGPAGSAGSETAPANDADPVSDPEATPETPGTEPAAVGTTGLIDGRIRNDRAGLQARYVELPNGGVFNERVAAIVDAAIAGTGVASFTPEVFDVEAGLADRGCAAGVTAMSATDLLADPRYGPVGGDGTAVVCEVTAVFGPILGVAFRTVTGAGGAATRDETATLLVDVESGAVTGAAELWSPEAAAELWVGAVQSLRRDAGALSAAPLLPPNDDQLALARSAFAAAQFAADSTTFLLPAGVTSEELTALGVPATTEPLTVIIDVADKSADNPAGALAGWLSPAGEQVLAHRGTPFVGVPEWNGAHPVDCALVACISVTYDDGPSGFTAELLDTLAAHESAATFFMLGNAVKGHPDVVARAASEGHELASHSMTHPDLTKIPSDKARKQVLDAGKAITNITGHPVTMYRPPYGALDPAVLSVIGQPAILWTIDTLDWEGPGEAALVKRSVDAADPGNIILFHDTHADTVNAAGDVLEGLKNRGFTPVTVTQLFGGAVPSGRVSAG